MNPKRRSQKRFEQLNLIVDKIAPALPTSTHVAVLMICFRHGGSHGEFRVSTARIACSACVSERQAKRVINELERAEVIELLEEHQGPIPRQYRITGKVPNGDTHDTNSKPKKSTVNGDTHDTIPRQINGVTHDTRPPGLMVTSARS